MEIAQAITPTLAIFAAAATGGPIHSRALPCDLFPFGASADCIRPIQWALRATPLKRSKTMANKQNANTQANRETKPLAFIAWHVNGQDKKSFWTRIGAAWDHKDGKGLTLQLELVPMSGRIVLRAPQAEQEEASEAAEQ
jgi:hypothetical protein